jgi:hypothetical protein
MRENVRRSRFVVRRPVQFDYGIGGSALARVEEINDLGLLLDSKMSFLCHIEAVISKSSTILDSIKRVSREFSDPYTYKLCCSFCLADQISSIPRVLGHRIKRFTLQW